MGVRNGRVRSDRWRQGREMMESKAKRDRFPSGGPVGTLVLVGVIGLLSGLIPTGCSTTEPDPGVTPVDSLLFLPYDGESIA